MTGAGVEEGRYLTIPLRVGAEDVTRAMVADTATLEVGPKAGLAQVEEGTFLMPSMAVRTCE
jgi:hypothetical protein